MNFITQSEKVLTKRKKPIEQILPLNKNRNGHNARKTPKIKKSHKIKKIPKNYLQQFNKKFSMDQEIEQNNFDLLEYNNRQGMGYNETNNLLG